VSTVNASGRRVYVPCKSGYPISDHPNSRRKLAVSRLPLRPASKQQTTKHSLTRSAWATIEERRDLDGRSRRRLRRHATSCSDRAGRSLRRNRLRDGVCFHHRSHRSTVVPPPARTRRDQWPPRVLQPHGRQDHHRATLKTRRSHRQTWRRATRPTSPSARVDAENSAQGHGRFTMIRP